MVLEKIGTELMEYKLVILAVLTLFLAWLICKFLFLDAFLSPLRKLPGPPVSPFLGNLLELRRKGNIKATMEWSKKYGSVFVMWPRPDLPMVYVTDVNFVKQVMVKNSFKHTKPGYLRRVITSAGNGLLTSNGKDHAWQRKMINPAFSYANLKDMVPFMKAATDDLLELWHGKIEEPPLTYADIMVQEDLSRLTLDVIGASAFGYEFKSVLKGDTAISRAFAWQTKGLSIVTSSFKAFPFYKYLPLEENRLRSQATKITGEIVMKVIKERHNMKEKRQRLACRDLLDIIMDMKDDESDTKMDDELLQAEVFTFLLAGHETTSTSMVWTLYELAKQPGIQEKIRKEAEEVLGDGSDITWEKLDKLQYSGNVIKESMRLNPAVSGTARILMQDETFGDYHIPAGSTVALGFHVIHRSEKYWPDPDTFKPERFENLTKEQESMMRYIFLPFSVGPRLCIGHKFAVAEMRLVLASLVQNFSFSLVPGFPTEVTRVTEVTTKPKPAVQLRIEAVKRKSEGEATTEQL